MNPLSQLKGLITPFVVFSFVGNTAILVSPIYMMQVLDRVVPSGNLSTLFLLLLVAVGFLLLNAFIDVQKGISQKRSAQWIEKTGAKIALDLPISDRQAAVSGVGTLKNFFKSGQVSNAVNIPWIPLFLLALALIHPYFVLLVSGIVLSIFCIRHLIDLLSRSYQSSVADLSRKEMLTLQDALNPEVSTGISAISNNLILRFFDFQNLRHLQETKTIALLTSQDASLNFIRTSAQLLSLSLGAALVVSGDLSTGGMIGASIITAKTIQTIETAITSFPEVKSGYQAYKTFNSLSFDDELKKTEVLKLSGLLSCRELIYPRGNGARPRLERISFELQPGECLAVIGDSGSGKTTLLHAICGLDSCPIGSVFLDETEIRTLGPYSIAENIGYLPQQAQLLRGTIAENISCFCATPDDQKIIEAAKLAGVHGLISSLPEAYQTDIVQNPHLLSSGQKQRVALARAIFHSPQYLFLDEPNALLDASGERQLCDTIAQLKSRGCTIVMVLHRSGIMGLADKVLLLDDGRMADFGSRAEVLSRMNDGKQRLSLPLNENSLQDLSDWLTTQFMRHSDAEFCQKAILVATEMFNAATQNGPRDIKRDCVVVFKFIDQDHCEIILKEDRKTKAAGKMVKIRSLIKHPEVNMMDLPTDEIGLAVLAQLADDLAIENIENSSLFTAQITSDKFRNAKTRVH